MGQEMEATSSSMARKSLFGATEATSYMGLTSGPVMAKGSGLGYSRTVLVSNLLMFYTFYSFVSYDLFLLPSFLFLFIFNFLFHCNILHYITYKNYLLLTVLT